LITEWKFNPIKKVMSEPMRQHYFIKILSQINPQELVERLLDTNIPFMSAYGEYDYTTPPPNESNLKQWGQHDHFFLENMRKVCIIQAGKLVLKLILIKMSKIFSLSMGLLVSDASQALDNDNHCSNLRG
jgi:hypothetical protein